MKAKENWEPALMSCTEGDTGALATFRIPGADLGLSVAEDSLYASTCWAALKVGSAVVK